MPNSTALSPFFADDVREVLDALGVRSTSVRVVSARRNTHWIVYTADDRVVLRRYSPDRTASDVAYELRLLDHLARRSWPVAIAVAPPVTRGESVWVLFHYLRGRAPAPQSAERVRSEQQRRGRLLARLHRDMTSFARHGQRPGWRRADEGLFDRADKLAATEVLRRFERQSPEQGRVLRLYNDRMQQRLDALLSNAPLPIVIHGDLAPHNIRYLRGELSGVLDFDDAHLDLRVADFALTWRGHHHDVIFGYEQECPLEPIERELLVPIYWAWLIASAVAGFDQGATNADWVVAHLLRTELDQTTA